MHTSHELIELAKQRLAIRHHLTPPMTDYRLAKLMDIRHPTLSAWRTGVRVIGTEFVRKFADACELPEEYVYACIEHERSQSEDVKRVLVRIAEHFYGAAAGAGAAILTGMLLLTNPVKTEAFARSGHETGYTLCEVRCRRRSKRMTRGLLDSARQPLDMDHNDEKNTRAPSTHLLGLHDRRPHRDAHARTRTPPHFRSLHDTDPRQARRLQTYRRAA